MSLITTHVLDTSQGRPAKGVEVLLEFQSGPESWRELAKGVTNPDGRIKDFLAKDYVLLNGNYRLTFETAAYFQTSGTPCFFPRVALIFEVQNPHQHYHVPLLLSPFGYSTYRGS